MIESATAITNEPDSERAGLALGQQLRTGLNGNNAEAVIVFASAQHDYQKLLRALAEAAGTDVLVGSSSAGEFTDTQRGEGHVSALALRGDDIRFSLGIGQDISKDPQQAARQALSQFKGINGRSLPYRSALIMTDALAGHTDAMVEEMTLATGGNYHFFGGGAGDDGRFQKTYVFAGTRALSDAVVALEILSVKPIGIGVSHGWIPAGPGLRVTEARGNVIVGLNGAPAVQAFEDHAEASGQQFDHDNPLPFFLHNILGIESGGQHRLRVPLSVQPDGAVTCAAAVAEGSIVHIMKTNAESAVQAAEYATRSALAALGGRRPRVALVFDCVATRLRLGQAFDDELRACAELLKPAGFVGCNTYGQIARSDGQFGGFHNCTAVICVLPE